MDIDPVNKHKLLLHWQSELRIVCHGHYQTADSFNFWNRVIGISSVISSAVAGSTAWMNYIQHISEKNLSGIYIILTVTSALLAAILTSIQTFLKLPEKEELSRSAAMRYAGLLRKLELRRVANFNEVCSNHDEWCEKFLNEWDEISRDNQSVPSSLWNKLAQQYMITLDEKKYEAEEVPKIPLDEKISNCWIRIRKMFRKMFD